MPNVRTLSIPCNTKNLQTIREFVKVNLDTVSIAEKDAYQVILAIDEACANAMIHGNQCDCNKRLTIQLETDERIVKARISDTGAYTLAAKPHSKIVEEKIKDKAKGGLGLMIMQTLMDEINYIKDGDQYCCLMSKQINQS